MNTHKDHVATCYCCAFFSMSYEEDYSDVTPGSGLTISCGKSHFYFSNYEINDGDINLHDLVTKGITCEDFEGEK